ncbi:hypothetical protein PSTT_00713 [Puccinia striiformis]|uniref:Uncharacterized protein n=1 Tax=Puccinia striiformis TaxID=27350 RepID=A0A2S4W6G5_9BASI|nr:hypothetical protein PSTT_00713 [Puccinia striiformis]
MASPVEGKALVIEPASSTISKTDCVHAPHHDSLEPNGTDPVVCKDCGRLPF